MTDQAESKRQASGRRVSILEGFVQTIGINMGGIYLPNFILTAFLLESMRASPILIGFATSIQFVIGLLQPLANILSRRVKSRRIMVAAFSTVSRLLFAGAIFYGMYNSGPGAETAFMAILLAGAFFMSFAGAGWSTWMADLVPESGRGRYFALRNSVCSVAGILAVLLGGWLLKSLPGSGGFAAIYGICAAAGLIGGVILLLQHEPPRAEQVDGSLVKHYKDIFKDRNFMSFVGMVIFFNLAIVLASPFFNVLFIRDLKVSTDSLTVFTALAAVTAILGNVFFGKLSDVVGNRLIIRICLLMLIVPTAMVVFIQPLAAGSGLPIELFVLAVILLQSFFSAGWNLAIFNTSLSISPRNLRSFYIGVYNSLIAVSAVVAPLLGGVLINLLKDQQLQLFGIALTPTFPVFLASAALLLAGLLAFPAYREGGRTEDFSLRDVVLRRDFPVIVARLFQSTFVPRIGARHRLAEDIADLRSPAAVVPLEKLLHDTDPDIRLSALEGLGRTGASGALAVLLEYFPRAGVLEKVELMKSLGSFAGDERVVAILLAELDSPFPTLRIRALRSLRGAARHPEVNRLALARLRDDGAAAGGRMVDEEYVGYLDLAARSRALAVLALSRPRYLALDDEDWRRRFLNAWSHALDVHNLFYRYLSLDQPDDRLAFLEECQFAAIEALARSPALAEVAPFLKRQAAEQRGDPWAFFANSRRIVNQAMSLQSADLAEFVDWTLDRPERRNDEAVLMLQALRRHAPKNAR